MGITGACVISSRGASIGPVGEAGGGCDRPAKLWPRTCASKEGPDVQKQQQQRDSSNMRETKRDGYMGEGGGLAEGVRPAYMWFLEFSHSSKCTAATAGPSSFRAAIWSSVELSAGPRAADVPARPRHHIGSSHRDGCPMGVPVAQNAPHRQHFVRARRPRTATAGVCPLLFCARRSAEARADRK